MTIVQLTAENVKRLRAVSVNAAGQPTVIVGGRNGQGKTSLIDSIAMALGGGNRIPAEPVRRGARSAKIVLETEELVIERRFTAAGGTTLEVKGKDGVKLPSPQAVLDKLCTSIAFDPLEFVRLGSNAEGRRKQAAKLVELAGLNLGRFDQQKAVLTAKRTELKAKAEGFRAVGIEDQEIPARKDDTSLLSQKGNLEALLTLRQNTRARYTPLANRCDALVEEIARLRLRLSEAEAEFEKVNKDLTDIEALPKDDDIIAKIREFQSQIAVIGQHNNKVAQLEMNRAMLQQLRQTNEAIDKVQNDLDALAKARTEAIAAAKFPVKGLGLSEDGMPTFNGIPLDQCSSAENIRIGIAMAIAASPGMPVMLIRDGSLLDFDSLNMIQEMAEEAGAQVWIERVGAGSECSVIIEDGEIKDSPESPA